MIRTQSIKNLQIIHSKTLTLFTNKDMIDMTTNKTTIFVQTPCNMFSNLSRNIRKS